MAALHPVLYNCYRYFLRQAMKNESVTLHSKDGAGFGFEVCSDGHGGLAVGSLTDGGPAKESGLIRPGKI